MSSESSFGRLSADAGSPAAAKPWPPVSASTAGRPATGSGRGGLSFGDFRLVRLIGKGDIGSVFLCRRHRSSGGVSVPAQEEDDGEGVYAMKVVDKEALALKKKVHRAEMESKVLNMVNHPFLPTLHALFEDSRYSCIVMEFCSGGDLHNLRHKQLHQRFSLSAARFYAAEVLVALEYLHMLGVIYRDLKPENVLVRSDGHIMLSDFDLSFVSTAVPSVESISAPGPRAACLWRRKAHATVPGDRYLVAEPVGAASSSFVGTHEYVSPEVASGHSHGSAVDWWALGIFIYEMIYGRTPFLGGSNAATLRNILKEPLVFPTGTVSPAGGREAHARSLISGLLKKDPKERVGSRRGAAEVKAHPFFRGLNFALIRSVAPPVVPGRLRQGTTSCRDDLRQTAAFEFF